MKIVVTNAHSVRNSGDAVLLQVTLQEIIRCFPGAEVTVMINDPDGYVPSHGERAVPSFVYWFKSNRGERGNWKKGNLLLAPFLLGWAILAALLFRITGYFAHIPSQRERERLLRAYLDADLIISCPGNFFLSGSGLGLPLFLALFSFAYGWLAGKPLYMMQQTVGPFRRRWEQVAMRWVLERVRIVAVRDEKSHEALLQMGLRHPRCLVLPDAAFLYRGTGNVERFVVEIGQMAQAPRPFIGLTVIDFGAQNLLFGGQQAYEDAVVEAVRAFIGQHGGTAILFPQVCGPSRAEDDRIPSRRVAQKLRQHKVSTLLIETPWTPDELKSAYGQMDLFAGTRLHSNIFALTAGTPVAAIAYYYKTYGIMQMLGLPEWVLEIQTIQAGEFAQMLEKLWQQRAQLHTYLGTTLPAIQQQARQACEAIRADFMTRASQ